MLMFNFIQNFVTTAPPHLVTLIEIGLIIIIASFFAFLIRMFRQPLIPAYIFTGILIGPLFFNLIGDAHLIGSLSEIGVAFLIFTAGLEIKFRKLKEVGKVATVTGVLQMILLFGLGFFVAKLLGFSGIALAYIGIVVAFSSTMIVLTLLAEKKEINSLHGRIVIGILLIQDIAAIIVLAVLSSDLSFNSILIVLAKALAFAVFAFVLSKLINPVFKNAAKSSEMLLLVSVSLLFLFIFGSFVSGLSLIIGAFFAGVTLANSDYKTEIQWKITPLREFFAIIFFVALGMQLMVIPKEFLILLLVLLVLVVAVKPLVIMFIVRLMGYKKRTSFLTGNSLAQTSEFSLVILAIGFGLGHINQGLFSSLVLLTILTMSLTTYFISYEKKLTNWFDWPLNFLNKVHSRKEELEYDDNEENRIIIFGCHRAGSLLLKDFEKQKENLFVVDYNPEIIRSLIEKKIPCIYGDFMNAEIFKKAGVSGAEIVISTIPDYEDNILLLKKIRRVNKNALIVIVANRIREAISLYKAGADYVIIPQIEGGKKAFEMVRKFKKGGGVSEGSKIMKDFKREQIKYLNSIHHILY
jgi:Kef-type K+ transport system membrane component KefB